MNDNPLNADVRRLAELLLPFADRAEANMCDQHWIDSDEPSYSYCGPCGRAKVAELNGVPYENDRYDLPHHLDGGYCCEEDFGRTCETCGVELVCSLTDYGCEQTLTDVLSGGLNGDVEAYYVRVALNADGNPLVGEWPATDDEDQERIDLARRVAAAVLSGREIDTPRYDPATGQMIESERPVASASA